jgi:hypothetical protein
MIQSVGYQSMGRARIRGPGARSHIKISRPFVSVWVAAAVLNCSEHRVTACIQDGRLPFAFNIGRPGGRRSCVRVATIAVMRMNSAFPPFGSLPEFLSATFPVDKPAYPPAALAWMFQCDGDHIYNLIRLKVLADVGLRSHEVPRDSLVSFLTSRILR